MEPECITYGVLGGSRDSRVCTLFYSFSSSPLTISVIFQKDGQKNIYIYIYIKRNKMEKSLQENIGYATKIALRIVFLVKLN